MTELVKKILTSEGVHDHFIGLEIQYVRKKIAGELILYFPEFKTHLGSKKESYHTHAEGLVGSTLFNHLFLGNENIDEFEDIAGGGEDSCAYFVSNLLYHYGLIDDSSANVSSLIRRLENDSNRKSYDYNSQENIPVGSVIFWDLDKENEQFLSNAHVGIVISQNEVISNSSYKKCIDRHPITGSTGKLIPKRYFVLEEQ